MTCNKHGCKSKVNYPVPVAITDTVKVVLTRAGVNSETIGIDQFNSNSILELERELELKDFEKDEMNRN